MCVVSVANVRKEAVELDGESERVSCQSGCKCQCRSQCVR